MLYSIRIYNRTGECIYQHKNDSVKDLVDSHDNHKVTFGLLFALKGFANSITPKTLDEMEDEEMRSFATDSYKLHFMESCTGLRFVVFTDPNIEDQVATLRQIYRIYCNFVQKNAARSDEGEDSTTLNESCPMFDRKLKEYAMALPYYNTPFIKK